MQKNIICSFYLFTVILQYNVYGGGEGMPEQVILLENYENVAITTIIETVREDLFSGDALLQDAGCIILLKTLERLKQGDRKSELIFARLSGDEKVVGSAADIIDSRLPGWYNGEPSEENVDDITIYIPLFHILGKADNKSARGTLVRTFLYLHNRKNILEGIPMSEEMVSVSLKMLKIISEKLCCLYPGRDFVIAMLEKDSRLGMLDIFDNFLAKDTTISGKMRKEIKTFIIGCMEYGDGKNGHEIRIKAVQLAGILVKGGEKDLILKIGELAKNDPYYVHKYNDKTGYSLTELKYPVREISSEILHR